MYWSLIGLLVLLFISAAITVWAVLNRPKCMCFTDTPETEESERATAEQIEAQQREFAEWIEAVKDPEPDREEDCSGYHPDNYHGPWIDQSEVVMEDEEELDLTGPCDPTDLFATEAMKRKRELRQMKESLEAELPPDHPKRKGR